MSCYFRHMNEILEEAGVEVTKQNKKDIDRVILGLVDVEYKNCSPDWKAIKEQIKTDDKTKNRFIKTLKQELNKGTS